VTGRRRAWGRRAAAALLMWVPLFGSPARAQEPPPPPPAPPSVEPLPPDAGANEPDAASVDTTPIAEAPIAPVTPPLVITGYVDIGFADAQGNGTSFHADDNRAPVDYGVDTFAPAVNARGEAASTNPGVDPLGNPRFVNGFLPRSAGIGGTPSFLINTASADFRYTAPDLPVMVFTRVQVLPRFLGDGDATRVVLDQAFGRITPIRSAELALSVGKFDPVFGIEYLENQANFRIGVTPSLLARYTTGTSIGAKLFYRVQLVPIASAISVNVSATNGGTLVESLQTADRSLTGVPVGSGRFGYELNLARTSLKLGASLSYGPRNDQRDRAAMQRVYGVDVRLYVRSLTVSGEYVRIDQDEGSADGKLTGLGMFPFASAFYAQGFWVQASYEFPLPIATFRATPYARYEQRHGEFEDFAAIVVDRITGGVNVGVGENLQVKAEYLANRELSGAPKVANNVFASSLVWTW
jgi:hypothetical protein